MNDENGQPGTPPGRDRMRVASPHDPTQAFPRVEPPRRVAPPRGQPRTTAPPATRPTERIVVPESAPRPAPAPLPPRRSGRSWGRVALLSLAAAVAIGAAIVVGTRSLRPQQDDTGGVATDTPDAKHPPQRDVAIDGCRIDTAGVAVDGTVRNPTDETADYVIEVQLIDPAGTVITGANATAPGIAAGTRTTWSGTLPPAPSNAPSATCKVMKVNRHDAG